MKPTISTLEQFQNLIQPYEIEGGFGSIQETGYELVYQTKKRFKFRNVSSPKEAYQEYKNNHKHIDQFIMNTQTPNEFICFLTDDTVCIVDRSQEEFPDNVKKAYAFDFTEHDNRYDKYNRLYPDDFWEKFSSHPVTSKDHEAPIEDDLAKFFGREEPVSEDSFLQFFEDDPDDFSEKLADMFGYFMERYARTQIMDME